MGRSGSSPTFSVRFPPGVQDWLADLKTRTGDRRQPGSLAPQVIQALAESLVAELARVPLTPQETQFLTFVAATQGPFTLKVGHRLAEALTTMLAPAGGEDRAAAIEATWGLPEGGARALLARIRAAGPTADLALRWALTPTSPAVVVTRLPPDPHPVGPTAGLALSLQA